MLGSKMLQMLHRVGGEKTQTDEFCLVASGLEKDERPQEEYGSRLIGSQPDAFSS